MSLKNRTIIGFIWSSMGLFGRGGLNIVITIILSRLLPPSDFGIMALLLVFTAISTILIDSGFSQAIIRDQNVTQEKLSSVFVLNVSAALIIYFSLFFVMPEICSYFHFPQYVAMGRVLFLSMIFESLGIIQTTVLTKAMDFRWLACTQCIATIISGIVAIIMATAGCGCWSLAANLVLYSALRTGLLWIKGSWKISLSFRYKAIQEYFSFSINLLLTGLFDRVLSNLENLFIGRVYSKNDLAFFSRAREIDAWSSQTLTSIIVKVTYPALVKLQDKQQSFSSAYKKILGLTVFCNTFIMVFLLASAHIIPLLWGENWTETRIYIIPWCLFGLMYPFQSICINIFQAYGNTKQYLFISVFRQVLRIIVILIFVKISIISMTWAIIGVAVLGTWVTTFFAAKLIHQPCLSLFLDSKKTFFSGVAAALSVWSLGAFLDLPNWEIVILQFLIMIISYFGVNLFLKNEYLTEICNIALPMLKKVMKRGVYEN